MLDSRYCETSLGIFRRELRRLGFCSIIGGSDNRIEPEEQESDFELDTEFTELTLDFLVCLVRLGCIGDSMLPSRYKDS